MATASARKARTTPVSARQTGNTPESVSRTPARMLVTCMKHTCTARARPPKDCLHALARERLGRIAIGFDKETTGRLRTRFLAIHGADDAKGKGLETTPDAYFADEEPQELTRIGLVVYDIESQRVRLEHPSLRMALAKEKEQATESSDGVAARPAALHKKEH